jgi:hypothetical protein
VQGIQIAGDSPEDSTQNFVFSRVAENDAQVFVTAQWELEFVPFGVLNLPAGECVSITILHKIFAFCATAGGGDE